LQNLLPLPKEEEGYHPANIMYASLCRNGVSNPSSERDAQADFEHCAQRMGQLQRLEHFDDSECVHWQPMLDGKLKHPPSISEQRCPVIGTVSLLGITLKHFGNPSWRP
jgi:hypothetical protein